MKLFARREIDRPTADVFAFLADASNNPRWQKGQRSCEWITPAPIGVGSIYEQRARFLGRTVTHRFEVTQHEPDRSITIRSREGSFPITVRRSVEPIDQNRSQVVASIEGEPGGLFRLAGPMLRRLAQRSVDADYTRLKKLLESERADRR